MMLITNKTVSEMERSNESLVAGISAPLNAKIFSLEAKIERLRKALHAVAYQCPTFECAKKRARKELEKK